MDEIAQDLRHSLRFLRKNPSFALLVALTLGLGIGANASIFSLLDQVLVRSLSVEDPASLVLLSSPGPNTGSIWNSSNVTDPFSHPMFEDFRDRDPAFQGVLARYPMRMYLGRGGAVEPVEGTIVSGTFFEVLGVGSALGRVLTPDDDRTPGAHPVAVLSHRCWQTHFGGDPRVLGSSVTVNGEHLTVVGVAAAGFDGIEIGRAACVFVPLMMKPRLTPQWNGLGDRRVMWLQLMARLAPGVTVEKAAAVTNTLYRQALESEARDLAGRPASFLKRFVEKKVELLPGSHGAPELQASLRSPLVVLMGMVGLVVLIACANVANLLLARASTRQREIALRLAMGASRARLVRRLLVESLLLSLLGAAGGLVVSSWTTALLLRALPQGDVAWTLTPDLDGRVVAFALAMAVFTSVAVGLLPALQSTRPDLVVALKEQAGSLAGDPGSLRLRKGLVVAQVALSAILLVGAGLFTRSLSRLRGYDPGFTRGGLLTFQIDPGAIGRTGADARALYARARSRLVTLPGVRAVSMASEPLMTDSHNRQTVNVEGHTAREGEDMHPHVTAVGPTFATALGMPLLAGRDLEERDAAEAPKVALVNESFSRHFFGRESPLGRRFGWGREGALDVEIVGLVQDARTNDLRETVPEFIYVPYTQYEDVAGLVYYLRGDTDAEAYAAPVRQAVAEIEPLLPVTDLRTMEETIDQSLFVDRMIAALSAAFGLLATLLAAVGLYGVMSQAIVRRTREIGFRVALGADRARILRLVLAEVVLLAAGGAAIGLPGGWGLGRVLESRLFGLTPLDLPSTAGAVVLILVATLLAGAAPALRAIHVEPAAALREE